MTKSHSENAIPDIATRIVSALALGLMMTGGSLQWAWASPANDRVSGNSGSAQQAGGEGVPKLFTAGQAEAGREQYQTHCASCHGGGLEGRVGPTLKGPHFASEKNGFTVGKIFSYVAYQMPGGSPGSLQHDQYVKLMAFILKENGYPDGNQPLTFDGALHSDIPLVSKVESHDGSQQFQNIGQF